MPVPHRFGLVALFCASLLVCTHRPTPPWDQRPPEGQSGEVARVRHHLEGAEALLLGRDVSTLTSAQKTSRQQRIAELRAYRRTGVFPHNHRLLDRRTPVFVDEHGTRCAMAFLLEQSGDGAVVSRIARTRNLARIKDLAGDPDLVSWLHQNGLTLGEAARIQPAYGYEEEEAGTSQGEWAGAALGAGVGAIGVGLNVSAGRTQNARNTRGLLGVACGLLGAGLGTAVLSEKGAAGVLGAFDVGVGLVSFGLGVWQLNSTPGRQPHATLPAVAPAIWRSGDGTRRVALVMRY